MVNKFEKFNLNKNLIKSLNNMEYEIPSKVQEEVIPYLLNKKNIIVKSKTGSGKTASFAIPIVEEVDINSNAVQGLIIAPTRELALQIKEEIQNIGRIKKVRCSVIFGKQPLKEQISELKQRVHIVVATPGRIIDHIGRGTIDLSNIQYFIIDEADKMLHKGFIEDMETIMKKLPQDVCKGMFSATIDENIMKICDNYMKNPLQIEIKSENTEVKKQISEYFIKAEKENKYQILKNLIYTECPNSLIIFANTKIKVNELYEKLKADKFLVKEIHGDMSQDKRLFIIKDFKNHKFNILASTDIISRGIHVDDIELVINYEVPEDKENYIHRIGRTGRVDKLGKAVTLVSNREEKYFSEIKEYAKSNIIEIKNLEDEKIEKGKIELEKLQKDLRKVSKNSKKETVLDEEVTRIYLNAGKKKKIRVIDIVGALNNLKGIENQDIGVIEVKEDSSYVDILNYKGKDLIKNNKNILIKKKQVKVRKDNS
ncbi:DEAD/DEAH box helicase [Terrisporobacter sp.]